jgi:aerobic-type carbon monoxide dehydrogenase small subunit (CoxS/CutS family)
VSQTISLQVDGQARTVEVEADQPLLYALRDGLGLGNPHFGCGLAQCGACTVHLDGRPVRACVTPATAAAGHEVTTLVGLGSPDRPHPIQTAYVAEGVPQCGYCINGWMMTAAAFLRDNRNPTDAQIREALSGLKCRCGTHMAILRAVKRAAAAMQGAAA